MTRADATGIPYDASLEALTSPEAAGNFFRLHRPQSEAAWCAEFSRLAYADFGTVLEPCLASIGFGLTSEPFDRAGTQAFLAQGPDFAVLAFRGSDDFDAWTTNLDALLAPWRGGGKAHRGFIDAHERVWLQVSRALEMVRPPLLITGHSLGAALATLAASLQPETRLYTFGSPRVGDEDFRVAMTGRPGEARRYVNDRDAVCRVPSAAFGYRHVGTPYVIDRDGNVAQSDPEERGIAELVLSALPQGRQRLFEVFGRALPREASDHAPINYVSALR